VVRVVKGTAGIVGKRPDVLSLFLITYKCLISMPVADATSACLASGNFA
jgi:hypothetical protein